MAWEILPEKNNGNSDKWELIPERAGLGRTLLSAGSGLAQGVQNFFTGPANLVGTLGGIAGRAITGDENFNPFEQIKQSHENYVKENNLNTNPENLYENPEFKRVIEEESQKPIREHVGNYTGYNLEPNNFGEKALQFATENALPFYLSGGATGIVPAAHAAKNMALSHIGGAGGQKLGEVLGLGKDAQTLFGLGVSFALPYAVDSVLNLNSRILRKQEMEINRKAFDENKQTQLTELEDNHNVSLDQLENDHSIYKQKIKEDTNSQIGQEASSAQTKINEINSQLKEINEKIELLNPERITEYSQSSQSAKNKTSGKSFVRKADNVMEAINTEKSRIDLGISNVNKKPINDQIKSIEGAFKNGKLSIEKAKIIAQNLNSEIYDRNYPPVVKNSLKRMHAEVKNFIESVEPSISEPYKNAQLKTAELKNLQQQRDSILKTYDSKISGIRKDQIKNTQKIKNNSIKKIESAENKYNSAQKAYGKDYQKNRSNLESTTFEGWQKQQNNEQALAIALEKNNGFKESLGISGSGLVGWLVGGKTGAALAAGAKAVGSIYNEISEINRILDANPALKQQAILTLKNAAKMSSTALSGQIQSLTKKINQKA